MFKKITILFLWMGLTFFAASAFAGKVELTTYYPAPTGEYNTVKFSPTASAPVCNPGAKGTVYYKDGALEGLYVCDGTQWIPVGSQEQAYTGELVTFTKNGNQTVADTLGCSGACWKGKYIQDWNPSLATNYPGCGITPVNEEISLGSGPSFREGVLKVDLRCFKSGFYLIEWDGSVAVDGAANKWAALTLKYAYLDKNGDLSSWKALASSVGNKVFEDEANPGFNSWPPPPPPDSAAKYSAYPLALDTRLAIDLSTIPDDAEYLYLSLYAKNVDNPSNGPDYMSGAPGGVIQSRVDGGFSITVTRVK